MQLSVEVSVAMSRRKHTLSWKGEDIVLQKCSSQSKDYYDVMPEQSLLLVFPNHWASNYFYCRQCRLPDGPWAHCFHGGYSLSSTLHVLVRYLFPVGLSAIVRYESIVNANLFHHGFYAVLDHV